MTWEIFYQMLIFEIQDKIKHKCNLISPRLNIFETFGSKYTKMLTGLINGQ